MPQSHEADQEAALAALEAEDRDADEMFAEKAPYEERPWPKKLYDFLELNDERHPKQAMAFMIFVVCLVVSSVLTFILQTIPK